MLLRFEQVIIDALDDRTHRVDSPRPVDEFANQVLARCAVAAIRSAGIRRWQLGSEDLAQPGESALLSEAFAMLRHLDPRG